jgi:hypothetical protein
MIGPTWREHLSKSEQTFSPQEDWVRIEIATALRLGKRVIPLLLSRTPRLTTLDLPQDISELAYKQYLKFEHNNMDMDWARLTAALGLSEWEAGPARRPEPPPDDAEFVIRREAGRDGSVEFDIVRRSPDGVIASRLSGRAQPADLPSMAALMVQPAHPTPKSPA